MGRGKGKLSKGQPRGARSASGRKRDRSTASVIPCDGVVRRRKLYRQPANDVGDPDAGDRMRRKGSMETDTCDALGRAYCAGLLGTGATAKDRLLAGRKIAAQYWRVYGFHTPDSLARFQPQQGSPASDPERERIREQALSDALELIVKVGRDHRRCFDQLVIDMHPDFGPPWLDRIVYAHRTKTSATERDYAALYLALRALDEIA